jgi:hypothetical protein
MSTYRFLIVILSLLLANYSFSQKIIFLHHSTGGGVYAEGNVENWFSDYNSTHGTSYSIVERSYPNDPYPWDNYPYDFWNLWVNGACDNSKSGIECLESLAKEYQVIIFKHCFPGAGISDDNGNPDVTSSHKTLENYKLQYRALREKMDNFPSTKFIVWTLAPLHRNATNAGEASRSREFVNWVKSSWLTEDNKAHSNIFIYDFFGIVAESEANPSKGKVNCLKYDYEGDHNGSDSHPNEAANKVAGPLFAQCIVDAIQNNPTVTIASLEIVGESHKIETVGGSLQLTAKVSPENATNKNVKWSIVSGETYATLSADGLVTAQANGNVEIKATSANNPNATATFTIEITNQKSSIIKPGKENVIIKFDSTLKTYLIDFQKSPTFARIEVFNTQGKKLLSEKTEAKTYLLPNLPIGIYLLNVRLNNQAHRQKIVY